MSGNERLSQFRVGTLQGAIEQSGYVSAGLTHACFCRARDCFRPIQPDELACIVERGGEVRIFHDGCVNGQRRSFEDEEDIKRFVIERLNLARNCYAPRPRKMQPTASCV